MEINLDEKVASVPTVLNQISIAILERFRCFGIEKSIEPETLHTYRNEWTRVNVAQHLLAPWGSLIDTQSIAAEVITTNSDKTEIHLHRNAYAVVTILGPAESAQEPEGCCYFYGNSVFSRPTHSGLTLQIPPNTVHGFRSGPGIPPLTILSVQSSRIEKDFYPVDSSGQTLSIVHEKGSD